MDLTIPLSPGIALRLANGARSDNGYPTRRLCKGLILVYEGQELDEEGVGFGVPVIKLGFRTIFSGEMTAWTQANGATDEIVALYRMNLEEKLARGQRESVNSDALYAAKNTLAGLYRRAPILRKPLTQLSNGLRRMFTWETTYQEGRDYGQVRVIYAIDMQSGELEVTVNTEGLAGEGITEVVVMNEQGAHWFDQYRDSDGNVLQGDKIGSWDDVKAQQASFLCSECGLRFTLGQVAGARLLRGRELIGTRLAWAGFGYSFPPSLGQITYRLRIEKPV